MGGTSATTIDAFLGTGRCASDAIRAAAELWERDSALTAYTVGALSGHLARGVMTVESYLGQPTSDVERHEGGLLLDAAGYFETVLGDDDPVDSERHHDIRARGVELAALGPSPLAERVEAALERLGLLLQDLRGARREVQVRDGIVMGLDEYLDTRIVELVVHLDDLTASGVLVPEPPRQAVVRAAGVLGELAARRDGLDAIRSLARAERHPAAIRAM